MDMIQSAQTFIPPASLAFRSWADLRPSGALSVENEREEKSKRKEVDAL